MRGMLYRLYLAVVVVAMGWFGGRPAGAQAGGQPKLLDVTWAPMPIRSEHQVKLGMKGGEGGQCLHGVARSPANDRRIYLAVDVVGVWKSEDDGASWGPCRDVGLYCLGTTSIEANPKDADQVFVYVQAVWEKVREPEEGLYVSNDAGATWTRVVAAANPDKRRGFRHLIEVNADGRRVYLGAYDGGLYRSDDAGVTWQGPLGLKGKVLWEIRSDPRNADVVWAASDQGLFVSRNGGVEFAKVEEFEDGAVSSVVLDGGAPDRIFAVAQGEGLYRSEDGGKAWVHLPSGDPEIDAKSRHVFLSPADPKRLILSSETKFRLSHDGGKSWKGPVIDWSKSYVQQGCWGVNEGFAWSWRDPNLVATALSCGMYASTDGGVNWFDSGTGYTGFHHGWGDGAVAFAAHDPDRFAFFCYDYAFVLTQDGGKTFFNGRLKEKIRGWWGMYAGDMSPLWPQKPVVVAAAGQYWRNQLVRSEDGGKNFTAIPDTDGAYFFVRFHPENPHIVYADDRRSDDGGKSFKKLARPVYAYAPSRPDTVYGYAEGKVWRSDDRGETWRALPAPPRKAGEMIGRRDLEVDPGNPDRVWVMTPPSCAVFDGRNWREIEAPRWVSASGHPFVSRMAIDPDRPNRIIVGLDTHGTGYLFLSDDGGNTWADITGNLPRHGSNQSLNIQPKTGRIFVGAGFGTWTAEVPGR